MSADDREEMRARLLALRARDAASTVAETRKGLYGVVEYQMRVELSRYDIEILPGGFADAYVKLIALVLQAQADMYAACRIDLGQ